MDIVAALGLAAGSLQAAPAQAQALQKPNIVIIMGQGVVRMAIPGGVRPLGRFSACLAERGEGRPGE